MTTYNEVRFDKPTKHLRGIALMTNVACGTVCLQGIDLAGRFHRSLSLHLPRAEVKRVLTELAEIHGDEWLQPFNK